MDSRECVTLALNHKEPDRVPFDLGAGQIGGIEPVSRGFHRELLPPEEISWALADGLMYGLRLQSAPERVAFRGIPEPGGDGAGA